MMLMKVCTILVQIPVPIISLVTTILCENVCCEKVFHRKIMISIHCRFAVQQNNVLNESKDLLCE